MFSLQAQFNPVRAKQSTSISPAGTEINHQRWQQLKALHPQQRRQNPAAVGLI